MMCGQALGLFCAAVLAGRVEGVVASPSHTSDECMRHGHICTQAGQTCADAEPTLEGFWRCVCPAPNSRISKTGAPAICPTAPAPTLDECTTHGHICTQAGQTCVDTEPTLEGFWRCVCPAPNSRISKTGAPAICPTAPAPALDECTTHGHICTQAGQTCVDTEPTLEGFWRCVCPAPNSRISKTGAPAICPTAPAPALDECTTHGHICTQAGQTCVDAEPTLEGFWRCVCPAPNSKISKTGGPALCRT